MKVYMGISMPRGFGGDEFQIGKTLFNPSQDELNELINEVDNDYQRYTTFIEKQREVNEVREYEIDDAIDINDSEAVDDAIVDAFGYDCVYLMNFDIWQSKNEPDITDDM